MSSHIAAQELGLDMPLVPSFEVAAVELVIDDAFTRPLVDL
ncbi:hypothetical protein [Corynebacterium cystitidis]|nr:hypothetical protein [Corynebacterium cystitidis]